MKKRKLVIINDNERFCMELESRFVKYGYIVMAKLKTADEALSFFEKVAAFFLKIWNFICGIFAAFSK